MCTGPAVLGTGAVWACEACAYVTESGNEQKCATRPLPLVDLKVAIE